MEIFKHTSSYVYMMKTYRYFSSYLFRLYWTVKQNYDCSALCWDFYSQTQPNTTISIKSNI